MKMSSNALTSAAQSPGEPGDRLVLGQLEVQRQEVEDVAAWASVGLAPSEERRELADVGRPAGVVRRERRRRRPTLGRRDQVDRDQDVLLEQARSDASPAASP